MVFPKCAASLEEIMDFTNMNIAVQNLETFLQEVVEKYKEEGASSAAELLSWIEGWSMEHGYGRLAFYAVVGIAQTCWKVYDNEKVVVNFRQMVLDILAVARRNVEDYITMSDFELFYELFSDFAE